MMVWKIGKPRLPRLGRLSRALSATGAVLVAAMVPTNADHTGLIPGGFGPDTALVPVAGLVITISTLVALLQLDRRSWPLITVAFVLQTTGSLAALLCLALATYVVASTWRHARLPWYLLAAHSAVLLPWGIAVFLLPASASADDLAGVLGGVVLAVWLPLAFGLWIEARRQVMAGLREETRRLETEHLIVAERARARERTRIARDMHDVVAHQVSLMVLYAGGLEVNAKDADTAKTAELIRTTGVESLSQLRDVLGVLRSGDGGQGRDLRPQPGLADLDGLIEGSRRAGVLVGFHQDEGLAVVPILVQHAVYRIVREGLTNVHKHAGPVPAMVEVTGSVGQLRVVVRNDAPVRVTEVLPGSGGGLLGLREQVSLLEGRFSAGGDGAGGFEISATIPFTHDTREAT